MSDPQRPSGDRPRRAEPLQPDKPGSGRQARPDAEASKPASDALGEAQEQERTAVDNARDGYA